MSYRERQIRTKFLINQLKIKYSTNKINYSLNNMADSFCNNVLVIAPHTDDEVIGCGGYIQYLTLKKYHVHVLFVTVENERSISKPQFLNGEYKRIIESSKAKNYLKYTVSYNLMIEERRLHVNRDEQMSLIHIIYNLIKNNKYNSILIPNYDDFNPDHRIISKNSLEALDLLIDKKKDTNSLHMPQWLFFYEVWGPTKASHICLLDKHIHRQKLSAMKCYSSQMKTVDYVEIIDCIHKVRSDQLNDIESNMALLKNITSFELFEEIKISTIKNIINKIQI